jgi:hypothetical protein
MNKLQQAALLEININATYRGEARNVAEAVTGYVTTTYRNTPEATAQGYEEVADAIRNLAAELRARDYESRSK